MDMTGTGGVSLGLGAGGESGVPSGVPSSQSGQANPQSPPSPPSAAPQPPHSHAPPNQQIPEPQPTQGPESGIQAQEGTEFLTDGRQPGDGAIRIRLGSKDLTPEEASAEYESQLRRLQGADKTTAAYRSRAEQAIAAANAYRQVLKDAGMLDESGQMLIRSPDEVRAEMQRRAQGLPDEPEYSFDPPDFLRVSDSADPREAAAATDAFYGHLEQVAQDRGLRYAFGLMADHMNRVLADYHQRLIQQDGGFLARQLDQRFQPIQPFFEQMHDIRDQGNFLADQATLILDGGRLAYPELDGANGNPEFVRRLISTMDQVPKEFARSRDGFARIVNSLRWEMADEAQASGGEGAGVAPTYPEPAQSPQQPPPAVPAARAQQPARRPSSARPMVSLDQATPSGVPRPRAGNGRSGAGDEGSRLVENSRRGVLGGFNWGL